MRVGSTVGVQATRHEVEPQRTPVSRADLRDAIGRAHLRVAGRAATPELLDVLTAHASLETGSGGSMFNFNFGGIKGAAPETGGTARCRTREVVDGREVSVRDGFRAYRSLEEGAADYVRLLRGRFGAAVARAEVGDIDGFARALKASGYYTADEAKYASALRGLAGVPEGAASPRPVAAAAPAPAMFADSEQVARMLDAINHHRPSADVEEDDG